MNDTVVERGNRNAPRRARRTSEEIRQLILSAARTVFAERGFSGATTRLIAMRAEVAEPLIFNNFGSKSALFAEAVAEPFNEHIRAFIALSENLPSDREQRSASFVHAALPFLRENAGLLMALVKSAGDMEADQLRRLDDYFDQAVARLRSQYEKAGLRFDVPPELSVRYAFGMLASAVLFRDWFFGEDAPSDDAAERAMARMLFKAIEPAPDDQD